MKIKYCGHSKGINITLPIGAIKKRQTSVLSINKGEIVEIDDETGEKILLLNPRNCEQVKEIQAEVSEKSQELEPEEQMHAKEKVQVEIIKKKKKRS